MGGQDRRIKLEKGQQRRLILNATKKSGSLKKLGIIVGVPYSTIKEYAQENFLLPEILFNKIKQISQIKNAEIKISYLPWNWGKIKGGKRGMATLQKLYPKKIIEWRRIAIKNSQSKNTKKIKTPRLNEKLAEFIGIYLGDGTMTKYFIKISGDFRVDLPYFLYLKKLIKDVFDVGSSITRDKKYNTLYLTIFSKSICDLFNKKFGLKPGNKIRNKSKVPEKILDNRELATACLRGLIDTDGSISRRGRNGSQFCIQFTSHNKKLLDQVYEVGKKLEIFTFYDKTGTGTNKWEKIIKYFRIVGSSNLRHIVRFNERLGGNTIYQKEVLNYYQKEKYKNLNLPFILKGV